MADPSEEQPPRELDPSVLTPREFISDAYGRWIPDRLDLFHDMSAEEGFIVDGDALVMEGFSNWNLEWPVGCGQQIHFVYLVEKLLHDFTVKEGMFSIVFFDCNRSLWAADPSKLLARDLLFRHLRATLPKIVFSFPNWWSDDWAEFIRTQIPSYILINDGEQAAQILQQDADANSEESTKIVEDAQYLLRAFMIDCIVKRVHCVYTTRLVSKDSFIHAFVVRASSKRFLPMGKPIDMPAIITLCKELFGNEGNSALTVIKNTEYPCANIDCLPGTEDQSFRVKLGSAAVSKVLKSDNNFSGMKNDLAKVFVLHQLVLMRLPIGARAQSLMEQEQADDSRSEYFNVCDEFFAAVIKEAARMIPATEDFNDADVKAREEEDAKKGEFSDIWDFRLMRKMIAVLLRAEGKLEGPENLIEAFNKVWTALSDSSASPILSKAGEAPELHENTQHNFTLLPTEDALVNQLVSGIPLPEMPDEVASKTLAQLVEKQRWLQRSQLWAAQDLEEVIKGDDLFKATQAAFADSYDTTNVSARKKKKMEMRMERSRAKFLHAIQTGAESMAGGFLPHAESRVITKEDKDNKKPTKQKLGSKAAEIAEKNKLALEQKEKDSQERAWSNFYGRLEMKKEMSVDKLSSCANEIGRFIGSKKVKDPFVLVRARTERLKLLEREWVAICKTPELKAKSYHVAVELFRGVHEMVREYIVWARNFKKSEQTDQDEKKKDKKEKKDKKDKKGKDKKVEDVKDEPYRPLFGDDEMVVLRNILIMLGLRDNWRRIDETLAELDGREFIPTKIASGASKSARVVSKDAADPNDRSHVRFQMSQMGHLFERSTGEDDHRVKFRPDPWQKSMLDYVDAKESILCCAPTSAGKTFISYYCIKEVMFSSNENVVVYVAPTRALCNQAAQDVYSIFGHKKYSANGWSLFGILGGGNYVQPLPPMGGPFMTQVLITIPSVFEHVMLAPRYQQWARRVKYVIFDEVHCVDTSGEGHLWERLLMCTRAPFLALSATVGNAEDFRSWLAKTQALIEQQDKDRNEKRDSYKVRGVYWNQRWNDLQKFTFQPRTNEARVGTKVKVSNQPFGEDNIKSVHPFSTVTKAMLEKLGEFPQDLPLVPKECLQLYDSMLAAFEEVSCMVEGTWSDESGHKVKIDGANLTGRKGMFKGVVGKKIELGDVPKQSEFENYKPSVCFAVEGGKIWAGINDEEELDIMFEKDGKLQFCSAFHEIDGGIMAAMTERDEDDEDENRCLAPEEFFENDLAITQSRSREYEAALKKELMSWVKKGEKDIIARLMVDCVMKKLGGGLHRICTDSERIATEQQNPLDTKEFIEENFPDLLMCLNSKQMLPALVFNFDQGMCEDLARKMVVSLEEAEESYKATPEWQSFVKKRTELMNQQKKDIKNFAAAVSNAKKSKGDEENAGGTSTEQDMSEQPELVDYSIPDILPAFAFVHGERGDGLNKDDFEKLVKDIGALDRSSILIRALERGIGVHHAGLPVKYRNHVERMFRLKRLKVVVATDGLALGIHSPCRTVVLAGDDVRLSTMQFRQMSGRAGRRGQDFVGHVIFYGIPEGKIIRLMTSGLPTLKGHVSIDTTTVLRMSLLNAHTGPSKGRDKIEVDQEVVRCMSRCMMEPLFLLGKHIAAGDKDAATGHALYNRLLRIQWRYTTDYLQREGLITATGTGQFLPGLVTRALYSFSEVHMNPSNLVLAALLRRGVFQKVCAQYTRKDNAMIVAHMSKVLAYLFTRNSMGWKQEIHRAVFQNPDVQSEACPHEVVLTPLNELFNGEVWKCMQSYTSESLEIFSALVRQMAEEVEKVHGKDTKLPVSRVDFANEGELTGLLAKLREESNDVKARSPFVAVCGLKDKFHCVDDLLKSLRSCIHLEEDSLPVVDYIDIHRRDPNDRWVRINAAACDYMVEGPQLIEGENSRMFLEDFNGLSQSLSWQVLNRFITATTNVTDLVERLAPAWPVITKTFTCCNTLCPPQFSVFTAANGLYKCHDCDKDGIDTWMCPKCYEEGEECVTKQTDDNGKGGEAIRTVKNKSHVFFRHVYDRYVQTMSHIAADLDPLAQTLGRSERQHAKRKKKKITEIVKPKRPILQKPVSRGKPLLFRMKK
eukprot:TRINITY_DN1813_c2_g1_i2.p1 TRINITY_DN1813_c2_g1~~TRINITY_DN1813_c2_g1_i2.p1  ORF type:complete len:2106 (+),score=712.11 TRINITY_DN1813_c2_g1_i2:48-6365(+)